MNFTDVDGNETLKAEIDLSYKRIKLHVLDIVKEDLERIEGDENLWYLLNKEEYIHVKLL